MKPSPSTTASLAALLLAVPAWSQHPLGLVVEPTLTVPRAHVFDARDDVVVQSFDLPVAMSSCGGDAVMTRDFQAAVSTGLGELVLLDLTTAPATVTGIVPISNEGSDIALSRGGRFVLSVGSDADVLSVTDLRLAAEVESYPLGSVPLSVDVAPNGAVIVGILAQLRRLTLTPTGTISDPGESFAWIFVPNNIALAPADPVGAILSGSGLFMFSQPELGLAGIATTTVSNCAVSGVFAPKGSSLFVRTYQCSPFTPPTNGTVERWGYDALGRFQPAADWFTSAANVVEFCPGREELAVHPRGDRVYLPEGNAVSILSSADGTRMGEVAGATLVAPRTVTLGAPRARDRRMGVPPNPPTGRL